MISSVGLFMAFAVSTSCAVDPPQKTQDDSAVTESTATESTADQDIIGGGLCPGHSRCYCACRANHQCWNNPAQCAPLTACLNGCDAQTPGCFDDNGPQKPESFADCL
jgi:hypothetical protein